MLIRMLAVLLTHGIVSSVPPTLDGSDGSDPGRKKNVVRDSNTTFLEASLQSDSSPI